MPDRENFDRDRDRFDEPYRRERNIPEHHPRGGSGSEGGYHHEHSYGSARELSDRGGGTGIRETESWRDRDFSRSAGSFGDTAYGPGWFGGMGSYATRGRFAGIGPKGWRRSDERILEDVNERLTKHPDIDATDIGVQVRDCEVTLTGMVDDRHTKRLAEDIAEHVFGVCDVHNELRVQRESQIDEDAAASRRC